MVPVDVLGREIAVGHVVTYPGRIGSSMWINVGVVVRVDHSHRRGDAAIWVRKIADEKNVYVADQLPQLITRWDRMTIITGMSEERARKMAEEA